MSIQENEFHCPECEHGKYEVIPNEQANCYWKKKCKCCGRVYDYTEAAKYLRPSYDSLKKKVKEQQDTIDRIARNLKNVLRDF